MGRYDIERQNLGLTPSVKEVNPSVNTKSRYSQERQTIASTPKVEPFDLGKGIGTPVLETLGRSSLESAKVDAKRRMSGEISMATVNPPRSLVSVNKEFPYVHSQKIADKLNPIKDKVDVAIDGLVSPAVKPLERLATSTLYNDFSQNMDNVPEQFKPTFAKQLSNEDNALIHGSLERFKGSPVYNDLFQSVQQEYLGYKKKIVEDKHFQKLLNKGPGFSLQEDATLKKWYDTAKKVGDTAQMIALSVLIESPTIGGGVAGAIQAYGEGGNKTDVAKSAAVGAAFGKVGGKASELVGGVANAALAKLGTNAVTKLIAPTATNVAKSVAFMEGGTASQELTGRLLNTGTPTKEDYLNSLKMGVAFGAAPSVLGRVTRPKETISNIKNVFKPKEQTINVGDYPQPIRETMNIPNERDIPKEFKRPLPIQKQFENLQQQPPVSTGNPLLDSMRRQAGIKQSTGNPLLDSMRNNLGLNNAPINNKPIAKTEALNSKNEPINTMPKEQNSKLSQLEKEYRENVALIKNGKVLNEQEKGYRLKALGMQHSANKRAIIQGESMEPVEGGLTSKELQAKIKKEQSNYSGKKVIVDGQEAIVTGTPYGKVSVKMPDGSIKTVEKTKVTPVKYNKEVETKIKNGKQGDEVGTLGDYLQGEGVRKLYEPVLNTPIKVTDSKTAMQGAQGKQNGKDVIVVNKNATNLEDVILEEAAHTMRSKKGRTNLGISGVDAAKTGNYDTLSYEQSANKMAEHAKTLDIEGYSGEFKQRGLITSAKNSDQNRGYVKQQIKGEYEVKENSQLAKDASVLIKNNYDTALQMARDPKQISDTSHEVARQLVQKYQSEGRWLEAIEMIENTAKKATESGRAVQALSLWSKTTPEGMMKYAQNLINKANKKLAEMNPKEFEKIKAEYKKQGIDISYYSLGKKMKAIVLTPQDAQYINRQMTAINRMPDGRAKDVKMAQTLDYIAAKIPPSTLQKVSTLQTIFQLLNAKTTIRNTLGNAGFQVAENIADVLGTPLDAITSLKTGERTKFLPSPITQLKGLKKGFSLGLEDAMKGIDTSSSKSQFDLPNRTFRTGFFGTLEKAMNITLRATDRAFYTAAYEQSMKNQLKAAKSTKATNEMIEVAHMDGLYRTFQDKNKLSELFSSAKRSLNFNKEFGFGDLILKYPKTPANLLMRGIDYSPAGAVKELYNIGRKGFDQKRFTESMSRAAVGTSIIAAGAILYDVGIIQGKSPKDKEAADLMKEAGIGQYTINLSALKRYLFSGLNRDYAKPQQGDTTMNYDWAQPLSMALTTGANVMGQMKEKGRVNALDALGAVAYSFESSVDTLAEQPLVSNATKFLRGYNNISESFAGVFKDAPSSFVPTFINQMRQLADNQSRDTSSDKNYGINESVNKIINKIPFASKTLPGRVSTTGKDKEMFQNKSNTIFNVFANPSFMSKYNASDGLQMVLDLYNKTGDVAQFPRQAKDSFTFKNKKITLTKEQQNQLQKIMGTQSVEYLDELAKDKDFITWSNEDKLKGIKRLLDKIGDRSKKQLISENEKDILKQLEK